MIGTGNEIMLPSLYVGIRTDYETSEATPTPDMIDFRVQKGQSSVSDEQAAMLQKALKVQMAVEQPRLQNLITTWVKIVTTVFTS